MPWYEELSNYHRELNEERDRFELVRDALLCRAVFGWISREEHRQQLHDSLINHIDILGQIHAKYKALGIPIGKIGF